MVTPSRAFPLWGNLLVYFGLLAAAMGYTIMGNWSSPSTNSEGELGALLALALLFPCGVQGLLPTGDPMQFPRALIVPLAYGLHVVFLILFAAVRERPRIYVLWTVYALYLLLNATGCRAMLKGLSRIT